MHKDGSCRHQLVYTSKSNKVNLKPMPAIKSTLGPDAPGKKHTLTDLFSRTISYLRLSLTDRCNLKCIYCVPEDGPLSKLAHEELLSYEELLRVVQVAVDMGISKLRLTGGEPFVRKGVMGFIEQLASITDLNDIRITTNGVLLEKYAERLLNAGVSKVNISLDTLNRERFSRITGVDCLEQVLRSIDQALAVGFSPVKINMVVMRGVNDDELLDFAQMSREKDIQIRFIEFMPIGNSSRWNKEIYMPADEIMARVGTVGKLIPVSRAITDGPAVMFQLGTDAKGKLGFISPVSHHFCDRCNRLRLTSEGMLRSCLLYDEEINLRSVIRQDCTDEEIRQTLLTAIRNKPRGHQLQERKEKSGNCHGQMSRIGG